MQIVPRTDVPEKKKIWTVSGVLQAGSSGKYFLENIFFEYSFCREFHYLQNEYLFFENKIILIENTHN